MAISRIAVIDFETTGLSPAQGDRATEVAIVLLERGQVVDRFQSLMNTGQRIPAFIEALTGISNAMVSSAPSANRVMQDASRFVGCAPMAAHNAAFDRRFWQAELTRADCPSTQPFACTLLLARRLYPQVSSYKLGVLIDHHRLPRNGRAHRALADAEMAAALLGRIQQDLVQHYELGTTDHAVLMTLQRCAKSAIEPLLARLSRQQANAA